MFTFPLSPAALFEERRRQFRSWGLDRTVVARVESVVRDLWHEGPGGWAFEWAAEARRAEQQQRWLTASALWGAARFPIVAGALRTQALAQQVRCFERASAGFPVRFERVAVHVTPGAAPLPVHVYEPRRGAPAAAVLMSGGVDTGKMELHRMALALAKLGRFRVLAIDMPGTGESPGPLAPDSDRSYEAVLRDLSDALPRGIVGVSFGGHWAAKLALQRRVDAAVNLGGPIGVGGFGADFVAGLPNGMAGIIAHARGLPEAPQGPARARLLDGFSLAARLRDTAPPGAAMLSVNGDRDPYIPVADVEVFRRQPGHEVWLFEGLGHCAAEAILRILPAMTLWLRRALDPHHRAGRRGLALARLILPRMRAPA